MDTIPTISSGEPSTLKTYRQIAKTMSPLGEDSYAVKFLDEKISQSSKGGDEIVIAPEGQMMMLIGHMIVEHDLIKK